MHKRMFGRYAVILGVATLTVLAGACQKKVAPTPPSVPTPVVPPSRPTVTLQASSTFISPGQSVTLTWSSTNATQLNLSPGPGAVAPEGSTQVSPTESTTYSISATGPGGTAEASARITVTAAAPPPAPERVQTLEELFRANVFDAFFDYNKSDIRADARDALSKTAEFFRTHPEIRVTIEGHCDERGSTEYNLGLGERRAQAAKSFLASLGVTADRMDTVSWGKERPFCTEHNEECWQQNRRGHFVMAR
jgi:peptidoglycan-associated lipoprotein